MWALTQIIQRLLCFPTPPPVLCRVNHCPVIQSEWHYHWRESHYHWRRELADLAVYVDRYVRFVSSFRQKGMPQFTSYKFAKHRQVLSGILCKMGSNRDWTCRMHLSFRATWNIWNARNRSASASRGADGSRDLAYCWIVIWIVANRK